MINKITFGYKFAVLMSLTLLLTSLSFAGSAFAAEYAYVDHSGNVRTVVANNSSEAMFKATDIGLHSGVMLLSGNEEFSNNNDSTQTGEARYAYIDVNGNMKSVMADSSAQAFLRASNIDPHSGVWRITN